MFKVCSISQYSLVSRLSVLQAMESWAGPGNEANHSKHHPNFWYRPHNRNVVLIQVLVCPLTGEGPKQRLHIQDGDE